MQSWNSKFKILSFTLWFCALSFSLLAFRGATCIFAEESEGVGASAVKPNSVSAPVGSDPNVQTSLEVSAVNVVSNAPGQISNGANTTDASDSLPITWQIEQICSAIYKGDFAVARKQITISGIFGRKQPIKLPLLEPEPIHALASRLTCWLRKE